MIKPVIALSASFLFAFAAQAAPVTYQVEPSHTFVHFSYKHLGLSTQSQRFDKAQGTVTLDQEAKTGSIDMKVDTRSVSTGFPLFNEHIQREAWATTQLSRFPGKLSGVRQGRPIPGAERRPPEQRASAPRRRPWR